MSHGSTAPTCYPQWEGLQSFPATFNAKTKLLEWVHKDFTISESSSLLIKNSICVSLDMSLDLSASTPSATKGKKYVIYPTTMMCS